MNPFTALRASLHFTSLHFSSLVLSNLHFTLLCYSYLHLTSLHFLSPSLPLKYFILLRHHSTLSELKHSFIASPENLPEQKSDASLRHQIRCLNRRTFFDCSTTVLHLNRSTLFHCVTTDLNTCEHENELRD